MKQKSILKIFSNILLLILLISIPNSKVLCQNDLLISQESFLILNDVQYINFIPVKKMDTINPFNSFNNKNFDTGIQFNSFLIEFDKSKGKKFKRILENENFDSTMYLTKVIPIKITYYILFTENDEKFKNVFTNYHNLLINNKKVKIKFNIDYSIHIKIEKIEYL